MMKLSYILMMCVCGSALCANATTTSYVLSPTRTSYQHLIRGGSSNIDPLINEYTVQVPEGYQANVTLETIKSILVHCGNGKINYLIDGVASPLNATNTFTKTGSIRLSATASNPSVSWTEMYVDYYMTIAGVRTPHYAYRYHYYETYYEEYEYIITVQYTFPVTLSFNTNGGGSIADRSYWVGDVYGTLPTPTRAGYKFVGWYSNAALTQRVDESSAVDESVNVLYAKWAEYRSVSFDTTGGDPLPPQTYVVGEAYRTLPTPIRAGYKFAGWYSNAALTQRVDESSAVDESVNVLHAKWAEYMSISFDTAGGDYLPPQTYVVGEAYRTLPTPIRAGYVFNGWYSDISLATRITKNSIVRDSVTMLHAKWGDSTASLLSTTSASVEFSQTTNTISVTTSSAWEAESNVDWITLLSSKGTGAGTIVYVVAPNRLVSSRTGSITVYSPDGESDCAITQERGSPSLYALNENRYWFSNDGGIGTITVTWDKADSFVPGSIPALDEFLYSWVAQSDSPWITISDNRSILYGESGSVAFTVAKNATGKPRNGVISFKCKIMNKSYNITVSQGEMLDYLTIIGASEVKPGGRASYDCQATTSIGTSFIVSPTWSLMFGSSYASISSSGMLTVDKTAAPAQTVTIRASYTEGDVAKTAIRTVMVASPAPSNDDFSEPTTICDSSGSLSDSNIGATMQATEPMPLAQPSATGSVWYEWTAPYSGTVTFDTVGSSFDTVLGVYAGSSVSSLEEIASNDDDGGISSSRLSFQAVSGATYRIAVYGCSGNVGDIRLNWNLTALSIPTYTVTYEPGPDGTGSQQTAIKTQDETLTLEGAVFTRTGHTQDGWSVNGGGGTLDYALNGSYSANADMTLYPHWAANRCFIACDLNGGDGMMEMERTYGDELGELPMPIREDYVFAGWFTKRNGGERVTESTIVTGDATYYALWIKTNCYGIVFDPGVEDAEWTMECQNVEVVRVARLSRCTLAAPAGKRFAGWRRKDTGRRYDDGMLVFNLAEPGEIVTLTAIWE